MVGGEGWTWGSGVSESGWDLGKTNSKFGHDVYCTEVKKQQDFSKTQERCVNVYENKGPGFHGPAQSANVIENKGTCEFKAEMLLKRMVVGMWQLVCGMR